MKNFLIILLILILSASIKPQTSEINLTGSLYTDSKISFDEANPESLHQLPFQTENKKSPFLAGLFSLVVPGSGEVYAGNYWKAAIFVAIEAAVITTAVIYDNKGNDQTDFFQKYADENWSVVKYAEWLNANGANITINSDASLPHWKRVNWGELNAAETGSHKLPKYGEQQYFELIGKYYQFTPGWDDFSGGNISNYTHNMLYYAHEHAKADDYYNVAAKAVIGIYINHFLSAIDAVWTTISYNNSLAVQMRVEEVHLTDRMELVPTLKLSYGF